MATLVSDTHIFTVFVAAETLSGIGAVRLLDEPLLCRDGNAVLFGIEPFEVIRKVTQNTRGSFFRENGDAVVCIRVALGYAHHTNPVFVTFERYEVKRELFAVVDRLERTQNALKIIFSHKKPPLYIVLFDENVNYNAKTPFNTLNIHHFSDK